MQNVLTMFNRLLTLSLFLLASFSLFAQKEKEKKTVKETIEQLPDMLIAQPEQAPDSNANKIVSDRLSIAVNPLWKKEGTLYFTDFKLAKTDKEPLSATLPLPDKKIVHQVVITLTTIKKTAAEKRDLMLADVKKHLAAYYKESGVAINSSDLAARAAEMITENESFTTTQGKEGVIFLLNDIQTAQSDFAVVFATPDTEKGGIYFAQIRYVKFNYETTFPEDALELKTFVYPDEQQLFIDFAKQMLKTLVVK